MKQLRKMSEGLDLLNKQFSNVAAFKSIGEQAAEPGSALPGVDWSGGRTGVSLRLGNRQSMIVFPKHLGPPIGRQSVGSLRWRGPVEIV